MKVRINGQWHELDGEPGADGVAPSLETVLQRLGFAQKSVATALNGEFVPARARGSQPVIEGDRLEVLSPMQGG